MACIVGIRITRTKLPNRHQHRKFLKSETDPLPSINRPVKAENHRRIFREIVMVLDADNLRDRSRLRELRGVDVAQANMFLPISHHRKVELEHGCARNTRNPRLAVFTSTYLEPACVDPENGPGFIVHVKRLSVSMGQSPGLASISEARASACVSIYCRMFVSLPFRTVMAKTQRSSNVLFVALILPVAKPTTRTRSPCATNSGGAG
jgi:hypothetical protein